MRRVVVPLDGSALSEAILPDARRLAGPDGELILVHEAAAPPPYYGAPYTQDPHHAVDSSDAYLDYVAIVLRADGARVQAQTMVMGNASVAIDEAVNLFQADMIAASTHGRGAMGRFWRGSVAWQALVHSPVPVLVRHIRSGQSRNSLAQPRERSILVPLDGSPLAESVLPLVRQLAGQWNAEIRLTRVLPTLAMTPPLGLGAITYEDVEPARREAEEYLHGVAETLGGSPHQHVLIGSPIDALVAAVEAWDITDVIMASHGRTGLSRVVLGSVAAALIHRLDVPIIVVPALAARAREESRPQVGASAS